MQLTQQSRWLIVLTLLFMTSLAQAAFDHRHTAWNTLLNQHVVLIEQGHASQVDYAGFKADHILPGPYLLHTVDKGIEWANKKVR